MRAIHQRIAAILDAADEPMSTASIATALDASGSRQQVGRHLRDMRKLGLAERVEAKPGGGTTWTAGDDA